MMRAGLKSRPYRFEHLAPLLAVLASAAACDAGLPDDAERIALPPDIYANDTGRHTFVPDPGFKPVKVATPEISTQRFRLIQEGEVIVVEGDANTVSSDGQGGFGIVQDNAVAIIQQVLAMYPDEFDTIQFYPAFFDSAAGNSAFYSTIANSVQGIGAQQFNGRGAFGLPEEGRLSGWSNMNDINLFADFNSATVPKGRYYSVISQELSHRWLMNLAYKETPTGSLKGDLRGRQDAHWSALVDAYGSCQDGIDWVKNADGTFTHNGESDQGFAPFDKYAMGILAPEEVEDTFIIDNAQLGQEILTNVSHGMIPRGSRVMGTERKISIQMVIDGLGPRNPPAGTETPYHRVAFVLVTAPGQPRSEWEPYLTTLQTIQETYPATYKEWTGGAGAICTQVSERCPEPVIGVESFRTIDGNDNNLAPGEIFDLELALRNDGIGTAEGVQVTIAPVGDGVVLMNGGAVASPTLAEGASATLPLIPMQIASTQACNTIVLLQVTETTREGPSFRHFVELSVGTKVERYDALEEATDWTVDPDGTDTASVGAWVLGENKIVSVLGEIIQPPEDHTPGRGKLSFGTIPGLASAPVRGDLDRGKTTLESPVFAMRGMIDPSLVFYAWHISKNYVQNPPAEIEAPLVIKGSDDGGETWVEMHRITEQTPEWTRVSVRVRDTLELTNKVRFRFEIEEVPPPGIDPLVEAAIDDLEIIDFLPGCDNAQPLPDGGVPIDPGTPGGGDRDEGCGCNTTERHEDAGVFLFAGLILLLVRRRARG
jgi:hypothetical protein